MPLILTSFRLIKIVLSLENNTLNYVHLIEEETMINWSWTCTFVSQSLVWPLGCPHKSTQMRF